MNSEGPYTFNVFDSAHYFYLSKSYVSFKLRLTGLEKPTDKTPADGKTEPDKNIYLTNFIGATFFDQVKLSFNNVQVYDSNYYAYKSYIETLLGENDETKGGILTAAGWTEEGNESQRLIKPDSVMDFCAPLLLEPFQTERLLIPHINIQLTLYRNKEGFCLQSNTDTKAKLEMSDLKLHMRAIDVVSSATIGLENRLRTSNAQYPFTITRAKVIAIPGGRNELPFSTLYHDIIPRRVIIGILDPVVDVKKDSLHFGHHHVSQIQLDAGGTMYPPQPINCDFDNKNYAESFVRMYEELGCVSDKACPNISFKSYRSGKTFFVFNLSPLDSSNSWELVKSGSTQLMMRFSQLTPAGGLNVLVLSQFDGMFDIDRFRNVGVNNLH